MKPRTVAVLAVLVAALAAFVWFVERDLPSSEERAEQAQRLLPFETSEVSAVVITWDGRAVRMERGVSAEPGEAEAEAEGGGAEPPSGREPGSDPGWRIVEPLHARADGDAVEGLLDALAALDSERRLEDADRAAVGLDAPRGRVALETGDGELTLTVGTEVPTSDSVLVGRALDGDGGEEVHVTSGAFVPRLGREPGAWRDRDLFPAPRSAVQRMTLAPPDGEPVVLARVGEDFRIEEPIRDVADPDRVDDLLSALVTLRAERFEDGAGGETAAGRPVAGLLEVELDGAETVRIELGPPADWAGEPIPEAGRGAGIVLRSATVDGQRVVLSSGLPELVATAPAGWRSPAWTTVQPFQVDRVEIDGAQEGGGLVLTRRDGTWFRTSSGEGTGDEGAGEQVPYAVVSDLLSAVADARGEVGEAAAEPPAVGEPVLGLRLVPRQHDPLSLALHEAGGGSYLATSSRRAAGVRLDGETVRGVLEAVEAVREAEGG